MPTDRPTRGEASGRPAETWIDERRAIGKLLHDGIMQDLTVLGFELSALQRDAPPALQPRLVALADWVATRQSALRDLVSGLVGEEPFK